MHLGNRTNFEFIEERNSELWEAFCKALGNTTEGTPLSVVYAIATESSCSQCWVSVSQASKLVSAYRKGRLNPFSLSRQKYRMLMYLSEEFEKIYDPSMPIYRQMEKVVFKRCPSFFMNANSAIRILNKYRLCKRSSRR